MRESILTPTRVTHAHTTPAGVVVVVAGIPALVAVDEEGRQETSFEWEVALRLEQIIDTAVRSDPTQRIHTVFWDDAIVEIPVDLEVRLIGPDIRYGEATVRTWKTLLERVMTAYRILVKPVAESRGSETGRLPWPVVAFAGPGSLSIGLRSGPQLSLFRPGTIEPDVVAQTLRLLVDSTKWVESDEESMPSELRDDESFRDAALRAVEELAPIGPEERSVELISHFEFHKEKPAVKITAEMKARATERRVRLVAELGSAHPISVVGTIDMIKLSGEFHLGDVDSETWGYHVATCVYRREMLPELLRHFGKRVKVIGVQPKEWRRLRKLEALELTALEGEETL